MEGMIHFKYWKNFLILQLYEKFSRNDSAKAPDKNFKLLKYMVSNWQSSDVQSTIFALRHCHNWCVDGETLVPTTDRFSPQLVC